MLVLAVERGLGDVVLGSARDPRGGRVGARGLGRVFWEAGNMGQGYWLPKKRKKEARKDRKKKEVSHYLYKGKM